MRSKRYEVRFCTVSIRFWLINVNQNDRSSYERMNYLLQRTFRIRLNVCIPATQRKTDMREERERTRSLLVPGQSIYIHL